MFGTAGLVPRLAALSVRLALAIGKGLMAEGRAGEEQADIFTILALANQGTAFVDSSHRPANPFKLCAAVGKVGHYPAPFVPRLKSRVIGRWEDETAVHVWNTDGNCA